MKTSQPGDPGAFFRLREVAVAVIIVLAGGTIGFMLIEHLGPLDALYTTIGIMSTSGDLLHPLSPAGRILYIAVVVSGVGTLLYALGSLTEYLVEGHFGRAMGRRRMDRKIAQLRGHAIICGYGRVGRRIAREFDEAGQPFVVIDLREDNPPELQAAGYPYLQGDATRDATLQQVGIARASMLLAATDADTENIAITLSARALAPHLWIVARANQDESESKLKRAGADRVLSPYRLGGHRMASLAREPHLVDFLDTVMYGGTLEMALEEADVTADHPLVGVSLPAKPESLPPALRDAAIIAIRRAGSQQWVAASRSQAVPIGPGDCLIVLRPTEQVSPDGRQEHAPASSAD